MLIIRARPAQTLLEAVIAIGVILVATISATALIITTITSGQTSTEKIKAANFAREGIEVVRQIRDSNWMKRAQNIKDDNNTLDATTVLWDDTGRIDDGYISLGDSNGKQYVITSDPVTGWKLFFVGNVGTTPTPEQVLISQIGQNYFTQNCSVSCTPTNYSRIITITKSTSDAPAGDYLNIVSLITWNSHGSKSFSLTERLYDWR